jgi:hypothetical protein
MLAKILGVTLAVSIGLSVATIGSSAPAKKESPPRLITGLFIIRYRQKIVRRSSSSIRG